MLKSIKLEEFDVSLMSLDQILMYIKRAFHLWYKQNYASSEYSYIYCRDVMPGHPDLGSVIVFDYQGSLYALEYSMDAEGAITFASFDDKFQVMTTYVRVDNPAPGDITAEGDEEATQPEEAGATEELPATEAEEEVPGSRAVLAELYETDYTMLEEGYIDLKLGEPGFGNQRDNNYYTKEMWAANASKFKDVRMHEVEHDDTKRDNTNWVATIVEAGKRFTDTGAPIVKAFIHDPNFLERAKNLKEGGLLDKLHNSIVAIAKVLPGQKIGDRVGNIVQEIVKPKFVDFVNHAGAGGHAMALYENQGPDYDLLTLEQLQARRPDLVQERSPMNEELIKELKESVTATQAAVQEVQAQLAAQRLANVKLLVENSKLPQKAQQRVLTAIGESVPADYQERVTQLIESERTYLAELGTLGVTGLGSGQEQPQTQVTIISAEEFETEVEELDARYGLAR